MRPWKVSLHNAPVIDTPARSLALKAHDWIFDGFFPRKIDRAPIYSAERGSTKKGSAIYLGKFAQQARPCAREGGVIVLSHPLCGASHSVQSRCSISFPYPMIPSHGPSSNRFKSAFAGEGARAHCYSTSEWRERGKLRLLASAMKIDSSTGSALKDLLCHLVCYDMIHWWQWWAPFEMCRGRSTLFFCYSYFIFW